LRLAGRVTVWETVRGVDLRMSGCVTVWETVRSVDLEGECKSIGQSYFLVVAKRRKSC